MKTTIKKMLILVIGILTISAAMSFGQSPFKGKIINANTKEPVPYASITFNEPGRGTITNAEGCFCLKLPVSLPGKLTISCIGYETKTINIENNTGATILLQPALYSLNPSEAWSGNSYMGPHEIFHMAVKNARKSKKLNSARGFLWVEAVSDNNAPLEVMEAFYQTSHSIKDGILAMDIKNGRFGIINNEDIYFSSLQVSEIYKSFRLFRNDKNSNFPYSPFSMSKRQASTNYIFEFDRVYHDEFGEYIARINFIPRYDTHEFFRGSAFIDLRTGSFKKITLKINQSKRNPLHNVYEAYDPGKFNMRLSINFKDNNEGELVYEYFSLDYDLNYESASASDKIRSRSLLVFYDYDEDFVKPICNLNGLSKDYEKIMAAPYNESFWENNIIYARTEIMKDHTNYFKKEGILINYDEPCTGTRGIEKPVRVWSPDEKIIWDDFLITGPEQLDIDTPRFTISPAKYTLESDHNLDFSILMDCNIVDDSLHFCCQTVFNRKSSYYFAEKDSSALEYINLQFDLTEFVRRQMAETLCKESFSHENADEIFSIYKDYMKRLEKMRVKLDKEVAGGNNHEMMALWKNKIQDGLSKKLAFKE